MAARIEDYALLGDLQSAALVSRDGSVDWLCLPRFDSAACLAALLGEKEHGRWSLRPQGASVCRRRYRTDTLILETEMETRDGLVTLVDFMPVRGKFPDLIRIVQGKHGRVPMEMELCLRFDYGSRVPLIRPTPHGLCAVAGPDCLRLDTPIRLDMHGDGGLTSACFSVTPGQHVPFVLTWFPSHQSEPERVPSERALADTDEYWRRWARRCAYSGPYRDEIVRSLITLKALTYRPTGGMVAAATTSLPEALGSVRNWDYRFCWVRDATFVLYSLQLAGYPEEAWAWREWLLRAVAGTPEQIQIMYGLAGERALREYELSWLPGYEGSRPVRIGNAAFEQLQLDIYGELMDTFHFSRRMGLRTDHPECRIQLAVIDFLEKIWKEPDEGIWEVRGGRRHFTHSKVMAWVAFDRMIKAAEQAYIQGPTEEWRKTRDRIHAEVCDKGFNARTGTFVQSYGSTELDASLLRLPLVGFLPATDPRMQATIEAIQRDLTHDGFVRRYPACPKVDGLPEGEGVFLACSFWLVDNLVLLNRRRQARELYERLLGLRNDLGLLSEEYDPSAKRFLGNYPQAFSHVALINSGFNLTEKTCPAEHRCR